MKNLFYREQEARQVLELDYQELAFECDKHMVSGIHPGYSCKEGGRVEDRFLLEFPCTPTRTPSVYSY
jgi:hypothetical protein